MREREGEIERERERESKETRREKVRGWAEKEAEGK